MRNLVLVAVILQLALIEVNGEDVSCFNMFIVSFLLYHPTTNHNYLATQLHIQQQGDDQVIHLHLNCLENQISCGFEIAITFLLNN